MMNLMNYQEYDVIFHFFEALEKKEFNEAEGCFCGNFKAVILNKEVGRDEYIKVWGRIKEGMPDAKFRIVNLTTNGDSFRTNIKIIGTHTHTFPPLKRGWRKIKPTGKKINKIIATLEVRLNGERIEEIRNPPAGNGAIAGLLNELQLLPKNYHAN